MKKLLTLVCLVFFSLLVLPVFSQSETQLKKERVISSYMAAFGRQPNSGEINYWVGQQNMSVSQLVNLHNQYLQSNSDERKQVIVRAFKHSYGYSPDENMIKKNMSVAYNYSQWMENHLKVLKNNSQDWNNMIAKVYWNVCSRWATDNDRKSWPQSEAKPYYLVAGVVDTWKKLNSSHNGLKLDGKSSFVSVFDLSTIVAKELAAVVAAGGGNVIAPGGGNVIAPGGGNVVASGGGNAVAAGGLN